MCGDWPTVEQVLIERTDLIPPTGEIHIFSGFAWALVSGLPLMYVALSNATATVGTNFNLPHSGAYHLYVKFGCSAIPINNLVNTSVLFAHSSDQTPITIVGPDTTLFLDNIALSGHNYLRECPLELDIPVNNASVQVTFKKTDNAGATGNFGLLGLFLVKQ